MEFTITNYPLLYASQIFFFDLLRSILALPYIASEASTDAGGEKCSGKDK